MFDKIIKLVFVISVSAFLFFIIYFILSDKLSRSNLDDKKVEEEQYFSKKKICMEVGKKMLQIDAKHYKVEEWQLHAEFAYNKNLDTCLYYGSYAFSEGGFEEWVKDGFTNKTITSIMVWPNEMLNCSNDEKCFNKLDKFEKRKKELFENENY